MESNAIHAAATVPAAIIAAPLFVQDQPLWVNLLVREINAEKKKGKAGVALRLGVKRAYVSRVIATLEGRTSGFPQGVPASFISRVIDRLHVIRECPATRQPQPVTECARIGNGAAPTHNPNSMRIWATCQTCAFKPAKEGIAA